MCGATLWIDTNDWDAMLRTPACYPLHHVHANVTDERRTTPRMIGSRSQSLVPPLPRLRRQHSKAPTDGQPVDVLVVKCQCPDGECLGWECPGWECPDAKCLGWECADGECLGWECADRGMSWLGMS